MIFSTRTKLDARWGLVLSALPFVVMIGIYLGTSYVRHAKNPDDKIVPTLGKLVDGAQRSVTPDKAGKVQLLMDTWASSRRFCIALGIVFLAVPLGVMMGCFPFWEQLLYRFVVFADKIPAIALLPILFIAFGLGELSKVVLMVLGVFPTVCLDAYLRAKSIPEEQFQKAHTLQASGFEICWLVVYPQIFPKMLDTIRLNFKSMMALLLAGEALAASVGLGYRIFVVRRYLAMDIIIPYVIFMTVLLYVADVAFQYWAKRYRWVDRE